ncbi:hypothetical protein ASZ90_008009 [hydrocarbon metagenome]|uniref:Uncharacterized protein n=1 Tax=hydrocarbon metagenome TaxID=938273 RepID=A0A0W8FNL9_9ZZZZ
MVSKKRFANDASFKQEIGIPGQGLIRRNREYTRFNTDLFPVMISP